MIKSIACIQAVCDVCGRAPENGYHGLDHFEPGREADAVDAAEGVDWWTDRATHLVLCDTRDDAHLVKAREILASLKGDGDEITFLTYWPELDPQARSEQVLRAAWFEDLPPLAEGADR